MKVIRDSSFKPITIVIESKDELHFMKCAISEAFLRSRDDSENEKFLSELMNCLAEEK